MPDNVLYRLTERYVEAAFELARRRQQLLGMVHPWDYQEAIAEAQGMIARGLEVSSYEARALMEAFGYEFSGTIPDADEVARRVIERWCGC